ncbi:unnamed protein product [Penicillium nalgiovense]|uniref:Uncharacterized protein n=1 Tax=Penicillium nalgiovense TaxID=60175 RepID=A0A9W4IQC3_PENNA|nr:unnamed protein product [Penicillium nalgiovense]CAG7980236.1 unnamed protein product [Penicillium nalgiovense]CAG7986578.1 unnamed protein product [Penicillium nalgiovense]CAG7990618.1 unnamed protein product [Penicillium nalgiovense]CAG7991271.1 unnamed protein product [Penicillium nalgiovense]
MPLHIRDIDTPESPSWGFPPSPHSMFTSSQNGKHPIPTKTQSSETPSERRSRLIRRFIQLGSREREIFAGADLARALEVFPERVTNEDSDIYFKRRDTALGEVLADSDVEDKGDLERDVGLYGIYHSYCVVTHPFIEDEEALDDGGLLHVSLDDCGNVVRP